MLQNVLQQSLPLLPGLITPVQQAATKIVWVFMEGGLKRSLCLFNKQKKLLKNLWGGRISPLAPDKLCPCRKVSTSYSFLKHRPHWVKVKHRRLQFGKLNGSDSNGPDVTLLIISALSFNGSHFRSHPKTTTMHKEYTGLVK